MAVSLEGWVGTLRIWWVVSGMLVFLMQVGFVYLEMGCVERKDQRGIAIKNLTMLIVSTGAFLVFGIRIMYGDSVAGILGWYGDPASSTGVYQSWEWLFLQAGFASVAATIVSGALAGRTTLFSNVVIALIVGGILFPIYGHWVWGTGFLAAAQPAVHDFAGSGTVHFLGGMVALVGAIVAGRRRVLEPDPDDRNVDLRYSTVGVIFLWIGWIGFNGGSVTPGQLLEAGSFAPIGQAIMATTVAACFGGAVVMVGAACWHWRLREGKGMTLGECFRRGVLYRPEDMLTGIMGGMVAVTATCRVIDGDMRLAAIMGGLGGGVAFLVVEYLKHETPEGPRVDDPVGAVGVHAGAGAVGMLMVGFLSERTSVEIQAVALLCAAAVAGFGTFGVFKTLSWFDLLLVSREKEESGLTFRPIEKSDVVGLVDTVKRDLDFWRNEFGDLIVPPAGVVIEHAQDGVGLSRKESTRVEEVAAWASHACPDGADGSDAEPRYTFLCVGESNQHALAKTLEGYSEIQRRWTVVLTFQPRRTRTLLKDLGFDFVPVIKLARGWREGIVDAMVQIRWRDNRMRHTAHRNHGEGSAGAELDSSEGATIIPAASTRQFRKSRTAAAVLSVLASIGGTLLTGYLSTKTWPSVALAGGPTASVVVGDQLYFTPRTPESKEVRDVLYIDVARMNWWLLTGVKFEVIESEDETIRFTMPHLGAQWNKVAMGGKVMNSANEEAWTLFDPSVNVILHDLKSGGAYSFEWDGQEHQEDSPAIAVFPRRHSIIALLQGIDDFWDPQLIRDWEWMNQPDRPRGGAHD